MKKLEKAKTVIIVFAISFYAVAKAGCLGAPTNFGGMTSTIGNLVLPVLISIVNTVPEAFGSADNASFYSACLAIQVSGLGLSLISAVLAYVIHALGKEINK